MAVSRKVQLGVQVLLLVLSIVALIATIRDAFHEADNRVEVETRYEQPPEGALRVLFLGNSHLYKSNIPRQVQEIAASTPGAKPIWCETFLYPGVTLAWHTKNGASIEALKQPWDVVVLQEQSLQALAEPKVWADSTRTIVRRARAGGTKRIVYLETWARHDDDRFLKKYPDVFGKDYADGQARLSEVIAAMAKRHEIEVAPVGTAWADVSKSHRLHADTSHANVPGSYLAALAIHRTIQDAPVTATTWAPGKVEESLASTIRVVVEGVFAKPEEEEPSGEDAEASSPDGSSEKSPDASTNAGDDDVAEDR